MWYLPRHESTATSLCPGEGESKRANTKREVIKPPNLSYLLTSVTNFQYSYSCFKSFSRRRIALVRHVKIANMAEDMLNT
jgi:hypothetical protein